MNELIKQLKEKGFPNSEKWDIVLKVGDPTWGYKAEEGDCIEVPNLHSLIKACGNYILIVQFETHWTAYYKKTPFSIHPGLGVINYMADIMEMKGEGSTPEIAVAKLWLELSKHD